ncbi:MAG: ferritin [Clostridiales bacterium]|nr:ferritin [Clostridiales bacterium]
MMNANVAKLMNEQINKELYSAYLYLEFANHFDEAGLDGFANWYKIQAREEQDHAMLFYQYLQNNNQKVTLEAIGQPTAAPECHLEVLKAALKHEEYVTSLINTIYEAAIEAKDYRSMNFLNWFIDEQGEEEMNATALIDKMEMFGGPDSKGGLYMLNQELAGRSYSAPSLSLD